MDNCDFTQAAWHKSRHSVNTACVEVATAGSYVGVRDSKDPQGLFLQYPARRWAAFLEAAKAGAFDYPR